jgi:hypothetical protein
MRTKYTLDAQDMLGEFVVKAGKTFLTVRTANTFGEQTSLKITPADLAQFYATQANNLTSGVRSLAGLHGDWRFISRLADLALDWFKSVNIEGLRRAARKARLIPKF